jgi:hypothetical protein
MAFVLALGLPLTLLAGPEGKTPPAPAVSILLKDRHGHVVPARSGGTYSGGGLIDVQQPAPDTVLVLMTGAVVATDHPCHGSSESQSFELEQCFDVVFEKPEVKAAKLVVEGRVVGLLRGGRAGAASESGGCATVTCGGTGLGTVCVPEHDVAGCESLSINDKIGPVGVPVAPGSHTLHARWRVLATHPKALLGKSASAEFAPDPALDPIWVGGPRDPFHGLGKKDFGLQLTLRLAEETSQAPNGENAKGEKADK